MYRPMIIICGVTQRLCKKVYQNNEIANIIILEPTIRSYAAISYRVVYTLYYDCLLRTFYW